MKLSFHKLLAAFFLFAAMAFANTASAQSVNWKSEQQAEDILLSQIAYHAQTLDTNNPGSPAYADAFQHVIYYKGILRLIYAGETVAVSTEKALVDAAGANNDPSAVAVAPVQKNDLVNLYNEVIGLLTN